MNPNDMPVNSLRDGDGGNEPLRLRHQFRVPRDGLRGSCLIHADENNDVWIKQDEGDDSVLVSRRQLPLLIDALQELRREVEEGES